MRQPIIGIVLLDAAVLAMVFPVYAFGRWLAVWDVKVPREEMIARFLDGFFAFMRDPYAVTLWSAGLCAIAIVAGWGARRLLHGLLRVTATVVLAAAAILGAWNLFTLM